MKKRMKERNERVVIWNMKNEIKMNVMMIRVCINGKNGLKKVKKIKMMDIKREG
jgi:hypothetical protein